MCSTLTFYSFEDSSEDNPHMNIEPKTHTFHGVSILKKKKEIMEDIQLTYKEFHEYNILLLKLWIFKNIFLKKINWITNLQIQICIKAKIIISKLSS